MPAIFLPSNYLCTLALLNNDSINGYCFLKLFFIFVDVPCVRQVLFDRQSRSSLKLSTRLERISISHSGNNMLRRVINQSSALELPVKMIIFFTSNLLAGIALAAFQTAWRAQSAYLE